MNVPESGDWAQGTLLKWRLVFNEIKITVIAQLGNGIAYRWVNRTVSRLRHGDGHLEGFKKEGGDLKWAPCVGMELFKFRVGSESAAGEIDGINFASQQFLRLVRLSGINDDD